MGNSIKESKMEVPGAGRNKFFVLWSEMIGTAFVLLAVNWGGTSSHTPLCVGLTVAVMAQMFGSISGGHFNPAVTVGMMIKHKHDDLPFGIVYGQVMMLFQFIGAWLGCLLCAGAMVFLPQDDKTLPVAGSHYITQLCPRNGCNDGGKMVFKVFLVEGVMTFFFVLRPPNRQAQRSQGDPSQRTRHRPRSLRCHPDRLRHLWWLHQPSRRPRPDCLPETLQRTCLPKCSTTAVDVHANLPHCSIHRRYDRRILPESLRPDRLRQS